MTDKACLITLTHQLLTSYYTDNRLDLLFTYLAEDVLWLGAGDHMKAEDREAVCHYFTAGQDQMFSCCLSDEQTEAVPIGPQHYLVEETASICERDRALLTEGMHNTFIYRRTSRTPAGWEILHLNNSITWKKLNHDELFARQQLNQLAQLTSREYEIAVMAAAGLSNREIATRQHIAEVTVKKLLQQTYQKLSIHSRVNLAGIFFPGRS